MVPLDFVNYGPLILMTLLGFFGLAALLLVPVYRFLKREERISANWTVDQLREEAKAAEARAEEENVGDERPA
ncbi:MAG: hypothetical protein R2834_06600 [Rhodothermales bacterium]